MYDYDRRDKFGNKRELHVDKALDAVSYTHLDVYKRQTYTDED